MSQVWKYELDGLPYSTFEMPVGSWPLHIAVQGNTPCLWMAVDPKAVRETRTFLHVGTGHEYDEAGLRYVGSYQLDLPGGLFVGHVYEREST